MGVRIISGLVGMGLFLGLCFGGLLPFALGVTCLTALGVREFLKAFARAEATSDTSLPQEVALFDPRLAWLSVLIPIGFCANSYRVATLELAAHNTLSFALMALPTIVLFVVATFRAAQTGKVLGRYQAWHGLLCIFYLGVLFSSFVLLRSLPGPLTVLSFPQTDRGAWLMLFVALCVWATDTFAYFVGRSLGKRKLAPTLSPNKTVEGSVGGLLGAMSVGASVGPLVHLSPWHGLAIGMIAGIIGQIGDLYESALKRELSLKDFGRVMPGHGGILDRFDSLLFVAPLAYLYLRWVVGL